MDDPSLASEMIKLLRDELERIRAQIREKREGANSTGHSDEKGSEGISSRAVAPTELYELQEENAQLRKELESTRARVASLPEVGQDAHDSEELGLHLEEAAKAEAEADGLAAKVAVVREKRRRSKSVKLQLEESVGDMERRLESLKARRLEEQERLTVLRKEIKGRHSSLQFNPVRFLQDLHEPRQSDSGTEREILVTASSTFQLPEAARHLCIPGGYILRNDDEVVWPTNPPSRSLCVCLSPTHRYNPRLNDFKGGWEPTWDMEERMGSRDLFYMKDRKWYYVGTYRWEGQDAFTYRELRTLLMPYLHHLQKRTVLFPDTVPAALTSIARTMIPTSVLKVACSGWRRVGFNTGLAAALQAGQPAGSMSTTGSGAGCPLPVNVISVPKEGARGSGKKAAKRLGEQPQGGPKKKHKKS